MMLKDNEVLFKSDTATARLSWPRQSKWKKCVQIWLYLKKFQTLYKNALKRRPVIVDSEKSAQTNTGHGRKYFFLVRWNVRYTWHGEKDCTDGVLVLGNLCLPISKGERAIILQAGLKTGWIHDDTLILSAKSIRDATRLLTITWPLTTLKNGFHKSKL